MGRGTVGVALGLVLLVPLAHAGEIPGAELILRQEFRAFPGDVPEATPPQFVLLKDGVVFVGGSSRLAQGRLDASELKALEKDLARVRKLHATGGSVVFGPGETTLRLVVLTGKRFEIATSGDPAAAPPGLAPLAALVGHLARFDHPSLRPYAPASYALSARPAARIGGCRAWSFPVSASDATQRPREVPASEAEGWPTGARTAWACDGANTYAVTLRPLLPGESP
jgi:hypothetical protein